MHFLNSRYRIQQWIGLLVGFIGVSLTLGSHLDYRIGTLVGMLSAVSWAIITLLIKIHGFKFDMYVMTTYQMLLVDYQSLHGPYLSIGKVIMKRKWRKSMRTMGA